MRKLNKNFILEYEILDHMERVENKDLPEIIIINFQTMYTPNYISTR